MESEEKAQEKSPRRALFEATSARIKAQNEADREARNAQRWKAERDPLEYEAQKERQRQQYIPKNGSAVRSYRKIVATNEADREEQAKVRDAERQKQRYAGMTDAEKKAKSDEVADRAWMERRRDKGIPEEVIRAGLITRMQERDAKRAAKAEADAAEAAWKASSIYGIT